MMAEEASNRIVNFMTPGVGDFLLRFCHISYIVKLDYYFYENLLLYSKAQIRQTEGIVFMSKEGSTKIVNFMTPG